MNAHRNPNLLTSRLAIYVCDSRRDHSGVQEPLIRHSQSTFGLILFAFTRPTGRNDTLERSSRHRIIHNPTYTKKKLYARRYSRAKANPTGACMYTHGIVYDLPVRLSRTVKLSVFDAVG